MTTIDLPATAGARPAREVLSWSRAAIDPALREAADRLPGSMRHITGYHYGWWDEHGARIDSDGGKAIRPALVLLAAKACGADPALAVPAAAAVELVHDFSLLHDDVMDGDLTRRHRRTAWSVFGTGPAILAGDALLTLAYDVLAASGHPNAQRAMQALSMAVLRLLEGQSADVAFEDRDEVALAECVEMARGKTGALLGAACGLGALFGGGSAEQVERFTAFGENFGLAFQHVDDLLGIWGDSAVTGKPIYSDLQNRKKSLPVVAALTSGTAAGNELGKLYQQEQSLSDVQLVRAAELIDLAGGRTWSQAQGDSLLAAALAHLAAANSGPQVTAELRALAELATHRDR
ncbi:MAG: Geranylgeranyl pyrophosphate synthase-like protein [Amycolatopsis sp.]|jgi:geranylgeranyl diphosphate synthase type I|uniref:family 2 encapsulin nanocompartment cargo protein polyprenyl transferase n=1 Tax=Amycolatopsis sp. TaxID=37632 RepID=UPI00260B5100|nr:family 2 encapsulin nanocompartment cargo protein polyprenyl transferase [Amycolatopsis sp.]MCU1684356.1 Geranylgeranyl pyrophosphate synthase-like protein [Amycolatopsis sp.]